LIDARRNDDPLFTTLQRLSDQGAEIFRQGARGEHAQKEQEKHTADGVVEHRKNGKW
jgi:hypothetical protein